MQPDRTAEISDHFLTCSGDSLVTCGDREMQAAEGGRGRAMFGVWGGLVAEDIGIPVAEDV